MYPALAADGIQLINEDDARRLALGLLEQIANARRSHTHKHLHKIASAQRKEGDPRFAGYRYCKQRFSRTRRADEQDAFGNFRAKRLIAFWIFEKIDYLLQLVFGFVAPGHIGKTHSRIAVGDKFCAAFAERQNGLSGFAHATAEH